MKLYLCPNANSREQADAAVRCVAALENLYGVRCALSEEKSRALFGDFTRAGRPEECDLIASLGGDGAVLRASQEALRVDLPILGINAGRLGYLCAVSLSALEAGEAPSLAELRVSERHPLTFPFDGSERLAVNDVVVAKGNFGATVTLEAAQDGQTVLSMRGDALILATPTGSTAYSLSAGGPSVDPALPAILLTPVCPHFGTARCTVLRDDLPVSVSVRDGESSRACVYADGVFVGDLTDSLTVCRSARPLRLMTADARFSGGRH